MLKLILGSIGGFRGYLYLAIVLGALGAVGAIYAKGRIDASHAAEMSSIKDTLALERAARIRADNAAIADAEKLKTFAAENAALEIYIDELQHEAEAVPTDPANPKGNVCLGPAGVERLRKLWEKAYGRP